MFATLFPELEPPEIQPPEGLIYLENFLSMADEVRYLAWIDDQPWETDLSRRRQFHGGSYETNTIGELPPILHELAVRSHEAGVMEQVADRCLINEYLPGQGIAAHVDYNADVQREVGMISLGDTYPMRFAHRHSDAAFEKFLARRSICVISGESRTEWTHEIAKRRADVTPGGGRRMRGRRVSITLRTTVA